MLLKKIIVFICIFTTILLFSVENFKGYSSKNSPPVYSIISLLESKYEKDSRWNENYFHDAQFPEQGITIFTNIIFSKAFFGEKGCKFNCIITFDDKKNTYLIKIMGLMILLFEKRGFLSKLVII